MLEGTVKTYRYLGDEEKDNGAKSPAAEPGAVPAAAKPAAAPAKQGGE